MYINGASAISPLAVFDALNTGIADAQNPGIGEARTEGNRFRATEPDYSKLIDPKLIRRMSRVIRMGVATAMDALRQAGISNPDAIITGTAYGCLEDTGIFLKKLVEHQEEMLTPTAFIQSTHNTVGAQVALLLKCNAYNNTYVQRAHSFERSLQDAGLWLSENPGASVLVGAADELTDYSFAILERFGLFRYQPGGEGAAYFLVEQAPGKDCWARVEAVRTLFQPDEAELFELAAHLMNQASPMQEQPNLIQTKQSGKIDLILSGEETGDANTNCYAKINSLAGDDLPVIRYKKYCGLYPTATAFASWLAAYFIKKGAVDVDAVKLQAPRRILVYQADAAGYHSFIVLSAC